MFRVAITTASDRSEALCDTARGSGLEPVALPCIAITPMPDDRLASARAAAASADWLLVTSSRVIDVLWPGGGMPDTPVSAVGRATGDAVEGAGGQVARIGEGGAASLVEDLAELVFGKRVFFPHADGADLASVGVLESAGAQVETMAVYATRSIAPGPGPVDACVFGSPSAVAGWVMTRSLEGLVLAVVGETTASALSGLGYEADVVPARPDFELLITDLAEFLRERSPV